jgi:prepilin-type N-terminal cleavage/methylation domain-containing protein
MNLRNPSERRQSEGEGGFTLIEMFVVLIVIGILLGLAMVMFSNANKKAADRAAQSNARTGLVAQKTVYADRQQYGDAAQLQEEEGAIAFEPLPETGLPGVEPAVLGKVFVRVDDNVATLVSQSKSGTCFWLRESGGATKYADGPCEVNPDDLTWGTKSW